MKKILLATTVFVAASAAAHAEVTLSGDARMGVTAGGGADVGFTSRARVSFTGSGETDNGLSFGASFRADNAPGAAAGTAGSVFISGAFGKLSAGDVDGASQAANGQLSGVGFGPNDSVQEISYIATADFLSDTDVGGLGTQGTTDPSLLYEYSTGAVTAYASLSNPKIAENPLGLDANVSSAAIGVKYATDAYTFGLGYETIKGVIAPVLAGERDNVKGRQIVLSASTTLAGATVKGLYAKRTGKVDTDKINTNFMGVSADYTVSGVALTGFVGQEKDKVANTTTKLGGIGASYDLGGGAAFKAGMVGGTGTKPSYDAGITLTF